ncbi:hypothetical protein KY347_04035 [Candidatus Woesearchaeota archaeon]|nr:hypothetical protein [Candidatus Woesearchaeota archaeon]
MKKTILIGIFILLMPFVMADSVTRTVNYANPTDFPNTVYAGDTVGVTYARSPSGGNYWAVDEYMPNGWDTSVQSPVLNRLRFYTTSNTVNYNFIAPSSAGDYDFDDGEYWTYGDDNWYQLPTETITVIGCTAAAETCDNQDNDCDYNIDEELIRDCSENYYGICAVGTETCTSGIWDGCPSGTAETCNNLDDDCDNSIDEGLSRACSEHYLGECAVGTETCSAGSYSGCPAPVEEDEVGSCDGKDNDCDGEADETQNTPADTNCNGCIENDEFTAYANKWIAVQVSNADFVAVANKWITLEGCS